MEEIIRDLKLLADRTRLTLLAILREGEHCVCDLVDALQTTQPNVSQHLRKLKEAGLVDEDKRGSWVYYDLTLEDKPHVQALMEHVPIPVEQLKWIKKCSANNCC
ncbi:metalloregulator ArsR/SmtB family transcription factor [Paenibacillus sp. YSY-4.3]